MLEIDFILDNGRRELKKNKNLNIPIKFMLNFYLSIHIGTSFYYIL